MTVLIQYTQRYGSKGDRNKGIALYLIKRPWAFKLSYIEVLGRVLTCDLRRLPLKQIPDAGAFLDHCLLVSGGRAECITRIT